MSQFISSSFFLSNSSFSYSYSSITQKDGKQKVKEASIHMQSSDGKHIQGNYMENIDGKKKEVEFNEKTLKHKLPKTNPLFPNSSLSSKSICSKSPLKSKRSSSSPKSSKTRSI